MSESKTGGPVVECPACREKFGIDLRAAVPDEYRMSVVMAPEPGSMMAAKVVAGTLRSMTGLVESLARDCGVKMHTFIENAAVAEDGAIRFDLVNLAVKESGEPDGDRS